MALDLQTADQMKNDFISRVSHELRTPLTAIKGWAETMQLSERGKLDRKTLTVVWELLSAKAHALQAL